MNIMLRLSMMFSFLFFSLLFALSSLLFALSSLLFALSSLLYKKAAPHQEAAFSYRADRLTVPAG